MEEFDLIGIGSGAGMNVGSNALRAGLRVALIEHDLMGGTCLNVGCIPSKILLYPADVVRTLNDAQKIGIKGNITEVDFSLIMKRMRSFVDEGRSDMEFGAKSTKSLRWYTDTGEFTDDFTIKVGREKITAPKIVIASGSRVLVPPIQGLKETGFIDNKSVLNLRHPPRSLIIMGGGYIACEYGHFFSAIGTKVTIIGRNPRLLKREEPEISEIVRRRFSRFAELYTGYEALEAGSDGDQKFVIAKNTRDNKTYKFTAEELMLASGRRSNADLLKPEKTGVETDEKGWIKVNEYLETTKPGIWALGDAIGVHMFRHTANYESEVVWTNAFTDHRHKVDYHAVPHAVFGYPQVGSVGLTEQEAKNAGYKILVGRAGYTDVTKGYAMGEDDSLVKVIVEHDTRKILGCHIVGSEAADLVQQVVYLMNAGDQDYMPMARAQIIHPALSEVVARAFGGLARPEHAHGHEHVQGQGRQR